MSHTPGPWTADDLIERHKQSGKGGEQVYKKDNARLIAAAPELLDVAQGALGYLLALPSEYRPDESWLAPLIEAIRKAKGE